MPREEVGVGEGLARFIAIGSILLTVASLTLAVVFARKMTRVRVGFDVARAVIGVGAILVMAMITGVTTPVIAVLVAVTVGVGVGFTQGSGLEITAQERGLFAKRTPVALVGWGAGLVLVQAAGIASHIGAVQLGQTVAWFSACMGIGLIVGRTGPLTRTLARAGTASLVMVLAALAAMLIATRAPAEAQTVLLEDDQVCALTPVNRYADPGVPESVYHVETALAENAVAGCTSEGDFDYTGLSVDFGVFLYASDAESTAQWQREWEQTWGWYTDWYESYVGLVTDDRYDPTVDLNAGDLNEFFDAAGVQAESRSGAWASVGGVEDRVLIGIGPFVLFGVADNLGFVLGDKDDQGTRRPLTLIEELITPMMETSANIAAILADQSATTEAGTSPDTTQRDITSVVPPIDTATPDTGSAIPPASATDPIDPEEAAGQAVAGLIAAAAIGLITWGEATDEITRILSGLGGGSSNGAAVPMQAAGPPPLLDEDGNPMTVSNGNARDAAGSVVPAGMVEWVDGDGNVTWIPRSDAAERVAAEQAARRANEAWLGARAEEAQTTWMDNQRDQAGVRRAAEQAAARERVAEREKLDEWGRRIAGRDALDTRQRILEADSARRASASGWWDDFYDEYQRGIKEDMAALPGELYDATGDGIRWVHREVTDPENWRVAGETMWDSAKDAAGLAVGDRATTARVAGNVQAGAETASRIAGTLWEAARNDPAGAAVGVARAVLGADNWERVIDKSVPVSERLGRAIWGVFDTGGTVMGIGAGGARVLDAASDAMRAADTVSDAARAADAISDAARAGETVADAARAADAASDAAHAADGIGDAARAADAAGDAARAGGLGDDAIRVSDDAADAARAGDAATDAGRVTRSGDVPRYATDPIDDIKHLPEGAEIIDPRLVDQTGYSPQQIAAMRNVAEKENVIIGARTTNMDSMRHIREGRAMPKPIEIKSKTISELDTYLGANPKDKGLVGYFEPQRPDLSKIPEDLHADVLARYDARATEYRELSGKIDTLVQKGELFPDKVRGVLIDSRTGLPYAGDIDPVFFKDAATGEYLSADRYLEVVERFKRSGAMGQHGAEVNIVGDLTMGKEVGSPEWREAYESAIELQTKLGKGHISGAETVVQMGPDGVLRRGPRFDTGLPVAEIARGTGFEV